MRFSMSIGQDDPAALALPDSRPPVSAPLSPAEMTATEIRLLEAQLERMRGMLFGYSSLFFATIRNWALVSIALLVVGWSDLAPAAVVPVPFIVPFAFLETGYLFWYTVFARRHAERLEQAINERLGREVLAAHRLEAAYFYPPDAPKIAAFSFGNPLGMMSGVTIGYTFGAAFLWLAGLTSTIAYVRAAGGGIFDGGLVGLVVPAAVAWTAVIAAYLVWVFLRRADEDRLVAALADTYLLPAPAGSLRAPAGSDPTRAPDNADPAPDNPDPAPNDTAAEPGSSAPSEPQEPTP
jgi:hypothetical protein